jgi:hypothetical protein
MRDRVNTWLNTCFDMLGSVAGSESMTNGSKLVVAIITLPAGYTTMRQNGLRALEVFRTVGFDHSGMVGPYLVPYCGTALAHYTHCSPHGLT